MPTPETVKLKVTSFGYGDHVPGDEVEVDRVTAKGLVASGHAKAANKTAEKALPAKPDPAPAK